MRYAGDISWSVPLFWHRFVQCHCAQSWSVCYQLPFSHDPFCPELLVFLPPSALIVALAFARPNRLCLWVVRSRSICGVPMLCMRPLLSLHLEVGSTCFGLVVGWESVIPMAFCPAGTVLSETHDCLHRSKRWQMLLRSTARAGHLSSVKQTYEIR